MSGRILFGWRPCRECCDSRLWRILPAQPANGDRNSEGSLAPTADITLRLFDSNRQPIATNVGSGAGSSSLQAALQPGFYIVQITTDNPAPLNYSLALSADFFSGGVDVGGYIGPGITGFGAFYVPVDQDVSMHIFGKNAYGAAGAGRLVLRLRNASRNVIPQVGP